MGKKILPAKDIPLRIASGIIPILVYAFFLTPIIPFSISEHFGAYSPLLFFILLIVYFFLFKQEGRWYWVLAASLTMMLFALKLSSNWASGYSDNAIIGGLLPYKDGFRYYGGAQLMLEGELLPRYSLQAAMRPIFPGFLSALLLLTSQNMQAALILLVGLTAGCCHYAAYAVKKSFGPTAAALFISLTFLFIQPLIGDLVTELLGLAIGCLGFIILLTSAHTLKLSHMLAGIIVMALAVSVRPGAFFIFPLLVFWVGWVFRKPTKRSLNFLGSAAVIGVLALALFNPVFNRWVVQPGVAGNGNFAYTLYGQVMGGVGFHQAVLDYGQVPEVVYQAAWEEFLDHPVSLAIATAKAYRDFFLPSRIGIYSFVTFNSVESFDYVLWALGLAALGAGLYFSWKQRATARFSLLIFVFAGIVLSIPFLPPIDGGRRFYASTMPFFFILPAAAAAARFRDPNAQQTTGGLINPWIPFGISMVIAGVAMLTPLAARQVHQPAVLEMPTCDKGQRPFAVRLNPGSYIDIVSDSEECGTAPDVCWDDFNANAVEKNVDPFVQSLIDISGDSEGIMRIFPGNDLLSMGFFFYITDSRVFQPSPLPSIVRGCAVHAKAQDAYYIQSIEGYITPP